MKKFQISSTVFFLLFLWANTTFAQVSGISYTVSPTGEYIWWDDKAGLENAMMIGGKLGFGFGQNFELRGTYMQSVNQKTDFSNFDLPNFEDNTIENNDVTIKRYGGEMKLNLSRGTLLPYLTVGTGIQSIQLDTFNTNKQIYATAGVGVVLSLGDRLTMTVEGKNTAYRFATARHLLTADEKSQLGILDTDFGIEELKNWSATASLQFYLGGRRPGKMSELDKAYMANFSNGFKGLSFAVEPTVGQIRWNEDATFRDTRWAGGAVGFGFGPYVDLRGFYWQGMQDGDLTKTDDIAMYGGEVRALLNAGTGLAPYLLLGGGKIDIDEDKYVGKTSVLADSTVFTYATEDKPFAMGGLGISIPFSKNFKIFGSVRAMLTSGAPLDNLNNPVEIQTNWNYSAGMKFAIGQKAKTGKFLAMEKNAAVADAQAENDMKAKLLKEEYEQKIVDLESKLDVALDAENDEKAAEILAKKEDAEAVVEELQKIEDRKVEIVIATQAAAVETAATQNVAAQNIGSTPVQITQNGNQSMIKMTPGEFENLIEEILQGVNQPAQFAPWMLQPNMMMQQPMQPQMNGDVNGNNGNGSTGAVENNIVNPNAVSGNTNAIPTNQEAINTQILETLNSINERLDANDKKMESLYTKGKGKKNKVKSKDKVKVIDATIDEDGAKVKEKKSLKDRVKAAKAKRKVKLRKKDKKLEKNTTDELLEEGESGK